MSEGTIIFQCLEVQQPIGTFYVGVMEAKDLVAISYADVRRLEERDIEKIVGLQRPLNKQRVEELSVYVNTVDASFPSGVILTVKSKDVDFDKKDRHMVIRREEEVAKIIDGQHRIAGLKNFKGGEFQVNVTLFVDMDVEDQAMIFATINLKQTKVSKSLAYDLYEYESTRSPLKTAHMIARLVNSKEGSPFIDKIKILGVATPDKEETLTQATFVERLLEFISARDLKPMKDRDAIKRGEKLEMVHGSELKRMPFRNLFIQNKDAEIAKIVWNYFSAVSGKWPTAWNKKIEGNILNRTSGFGALMRFMRDAIHHVGQPDRVFPIEKYSEVFNKIKLKDADFNPDKYKPGTSGEVQLYNDLLTQSGIDKVS